MSKIKNHQDLLNEEHRLQGILRDREILIRQDLMSFQENLEPIKKVYDQVHKIFTRDNRVPIFNIGLEMGIDLVLKRFLLARASWLIKTFVPYLVKNYSSHIIGEEKRKLIIKKIEELFSKLRPKKHAEAKS